MLLPTPAFAQTHPLNDTGQTQCYDGSALVACTAANTGDNAAYPGQDARFGRDAAQRAGQLPDKTGGGAAGFDFTALDASGSATTSLGSHECVYDNVTGLLWSAETLPDMSWNAATSAHPSDGSGSYTRCGRSTGWRLPTRRELLSIVHFGITDSSKPAIDLDYFPGTSRAIYWTADPYKPDPADAWLVSFGYGNTFAGYKTVSYSVRLVRSGQ